MAPRYIPTYFLRPLIPVFNTTLKSTTHSSKHPIVPHALNLIPRALNATAHILLMPNQTALEHQHPSSEKKAEVNKVEDGDLEGKRLFWSIFGGFLVVMVVLSVIGCVYGHSCSRLRKHGDDGIERDINGDPIREDTPETQEADKEDGFVIGERRRVRENTG